MPHFVCVPSIEKNKPVADSNSTTYMVVFTPVDTANYNTVETAVSLMADNKAELALPTFVFHVTIIKKE